MSIHTHFETYLSASTLSSFIKKAKSLNRNYVAYTDYGLMTGAFKFYKEAKNNGLKPIIGTELLLFDNNCKYCKSAGGAYYPVTIYAKDEKAYKKLTELSAHKNTLYETKSEDTIPLISWDDLEKYKGHNFELAIGGHLSLPYRLFSKGLGKESVEVLEKFKSILPLNLFLCAGNEDSIWRESVVIETGERVLFIKKEKKIDTDKAKNISASELVSDRHSEIHAVYNGNIRHQYKNPIVIKSRKVESNFKKLSKNYSKDSNQLMLKFSKHLNLNLLISDYAFMAEKEHKDVQIARIEGRRLKSDYYMMSEDEITQNISDHGIPLNDIKNAILKSQIWANQFNLNL